MSVECGTRQGYDRHHKRKEEACQACKAAYAAWKAADRRAKATRPDLPHGTYTGYANWGCHCDACRAAHTEKWRERRRGWLKV